MVNLPLTPIERKNSSSGASSVENTREPTAGSTSMSVPVTKRLVTLGSPREGVDSDSARFFQHGNPSEAGVPFLWREEAVKEADGGSLGKITRYQFFNLSAHCFRGGPAIKPLSDAF